MIRLFLLPFITLLLAFFYAEVEQQSSTPSQRLAEKIYPKHLTGTFTGGFGEETCRSCHFDYDVNPMEGNLKISGIPQKLTAGEAIGIKIIVERAELGAAGFQLSARYEDGSQAGQFVIEGNDRIMFTESVPDSLQYVQHANEGAKSFLENKISWKVRWKAPKSPKGTVVFNIAANAANGDQSEFGDFIYAEEVKVEF